MRKFFILTISLWLSGPLSAQWKMGIPHSDGTTGFRTLSAPRDDGPRSDDEDGFAQLSGFPKGFVADPNFKNFRNVALADLDGDDAQEIIIGILDQLYVFKNDQILWQKALEGVAIYPPSVADVDNDGDLEIVQITGGLGKTGAYLLEADGSDFPGWPLDFSDNWLITGPTLVDLDDDRMMEIIISERIPPNGQIHVLRLDGSSFSPDWPVAVPAIPAVTPSVGDVDKDGELEIFFNTTETRYLLRLDGQPEAGFPIETHPRQRYSFQSPILADLDDDEDLEIIGATHSDNVVRLPEFYVMQHNGNDYPGWPIPVPDQSWTYSTPTVVEIDGQLRIFMSRPNGDAVEDMLYCWDKDGNPCPGFPIAKYGGLEGLISVADVDGDSKYELIFGSNIMDEEGFGRIHAYELDGTGEVPGFPIHTAGWTLMNGAAFGDIDGNDTLDLVALSIRPTFNQGVDSTFLNVYNLGVPYSAKSVLWGTYKGSNSRQGLVERSGVSATQSLLDIESLQLHLFPNPARTASRLSLEIPAPAFVRLDLLDARGRWLHAVYQGQRPAGAWQVEVDLEAYPAGLYFARLQLGNRSALLKMSKQ